MAERPGLICTPPRDLELRRRIASSNRSAILTLTTDDPSSKYAAAAASMGTTPLSGNKRPALDLPPDLSPSPSKNYPDYSIAKKVVTLLRLGTILCNGRLREKGFLRLIHGRWTKKKLLPMQTRHRCMQLLSLKSSRCVGRQLLMLLCWGEMGWRMFPLHRPSSNL
jgi:hypothetical protein